MKQTIILKANREDAGPAIRFLEGLPLGKPWRVEIEEYRPRRTESQNNYLWGVCYKLIGEAIGYEKEEVGEFLCGAYFGWKDKRVPKKPSNPEGIESVPIRTTTTDEGGRKSVLSKTEFSDYIAFVHRFAASKGVYIPDPEEA